MRLWDLRNLEQGPVARLHRSCHTNQRLYFDAVGGCLLSGDDKGYLNWYDLSPWIYSEQNDTNARDNSPAVEVEDVDGNCGRLLGMAPVRREKLSDSVIVSASCHRGKHGDNKEQLPKIAIATGQREFSEYREDLLAIDNDFGVTLDMGSSSTDLDTSGEVFVDAQSEEDDTPPKRRRVDLSDGQKDALARILSPEIGHDDLEIESVDVKVKTRFTSDVKSQKGNSSRVQVWNVE